VVARPFHARHGLSYGSKAGILTGYRITEERKKKMKKLFAVILLTLVCSTAAAAVTVQYSNTDSTTYEWDAICGGSTLKVKFDSHSTSTTTIQGSSPCVIKTPQGDVTVKGGEKLDIQNGKVTVK
jgi:hypothetical protein